MRDAPVFTYQTRPLLSPEQVDALDAYGELYGRVERSLFAALQDKDANLNDLKRGFMRDHGLTARQFNAIRIGLDGKIDSIKQRRPQLIADLKVKISKAKRLIGKLEKKAPGSSKLHQKKRRLSILDTKMSAMTAAHTAGTVRLCFGGKPLFRAQFDLQANGYVSHDEWRAAWRESRSGQFMVLGSQDETAGCQGCQARVDEGGALSLFLRLPNALAAKGKYVEIGGVRFAYGQDQVIAALGHSRRIEATTKDGKPIVKRVGSALTYRFVRDETGWRVFVTVEAAPVAIVSDETRGAIGIDINADHLAVAETDRFGNLAGTWRLDLPLYGKTPQQAKAIIGDAVVRLAGQARQAQKVVVFEALEFAKKKAELEAADHRYARMLSSFACSRLSAGLKAACFRAGVEARQVNPAYTSTIGAVNFAQRLGISVHQGAAFAIARRGMGFSERPAVRDGVVPTRNGGHVTFALPARNRAKHVWSFWSGVRRQLQAAHVAHFRCDGHKRPPPPLPPARPALGATWKSTAKSRGANRSQNCSESVIDDVIPW